MHTVVKEWATSAGYNAAVLLVNNSHHCGYVEVPQGHPLHSIHYRDTPAGLQQFKEQIESSPFGKRGVIDVFLYALGGQEVSLSVLIDVHGSITYSGGYDNYPVPSDGKGWWFGFDCNHAGDSIGIQTAEYVEQECESLAKQLLDIGKKLAETAVEN